ncbi:hypothetical protein L7F22_049800 [Adiantum nelumboides]|nr:hypothetical protein [Adiantum nelumboides]
MERGRGRGRGEGIRDESVVRAEAGWVDAIGAGRGEGMISERGVGVQLVNQVQPVNQDSEGGQMQGDFWNNNLEAVGCAETRPRDCKKQPLMDCQLLTTFIKRLKQASCVKQPLCSAVNQESSDFPLSRSRGLTSCYSTADMDCIDEGVSSLRFSRSIGACSWVSASSKREKFAMLAIISSQTWGSQRVKSLQNPSGVLQDFARKAAFWRHFKRWRLLKGKVFASPRMICFPSYKDALGRKIWLWGVKSALSLQEEGLT